LTETEAYLAALRILTRSDRSVADLGKRLRQRNFPEEQVAAAIERCLALGYLDDRRLAGRLARTFSESGRAVGRRLLFEMKKRGIPAELAEAAIAELDTTLASEQVAGILLRRFPEFDPRTANPALRRRVLGFFQRRGYRLDEIFSAFDTLAETLEADAN
jgi:regulatory protein